MTVFCVSVVLINSLVKVARQEGVSNGLIWNFRNIILTSTALLLLRRNPLPEFPHSKRRALFARVTSGQSNFLAMNLAVALLPISVLTVIGKTSPFWIAILAYFFLGERILPIEIAGMFVCFGAFFYMTATN